MRRKGIALILIGLCLLLSITACSENAKSEQDICEEIKSCFLNDYPYINFNEVSVSVDQRQTNKNDKTDFVWASVFASNDDLQVIGSYSATYVLYNDGWVLESCNQDDGETRLLRSTVTEVQAENDAWYASLANYDSLTYIGRDTNLDFGEDAFYFEGQYSDGYKTTVDTIEVKYRYNYILNKWEEPYVDCISTDDIWNVLGKWEYNNGNDSMWLYIHEMGNGVAKIEYDFEYTWEDDVIFYGHQKEDRHYTSNGVETRQYGVSYEGYSTSFGLLADGDYSCYITIDKTEGVSFDDNLAEADDRYYFTYAGE